jgi:mxaJ protein
VPSLVPKSKKSNKSALGAVLAALFMAVGVAFAEEPFEMPRAFKVCGDPNNLPFSNDKGEGFENRISTLIAEKLGLKLEYFYYPQRINIVRNTIRYKLPNESEYRCDVLPGMPSDFTAAVPTKEYFRSTYVLVYAKGRKIDVASAEQFLALDPAVLSGLKIGVYEKTPAVEWLLRHDLIKQAVPRRILNADPGDYPGKIIEDLLIPGKVDAVVVWGPIGGYFAKLANGAELAVIPLKSEPRVRFDFGVSMAVRQGETAWRDRIQQALDESREDIGRILREYGIPRLDDKGNLIP